MRILVIEDEARILAFLARGLEAEGYSVDGAATDGRARARAGGAWDLVVLDLLLPGLDGLDVLRELHRDARPELPVLILSARSDLPTKLRGLRSRRARLPPEAVLARRAARARPRAAAARPPVGDDGNVIRVGALTLDLARRRARIEDAVCDLSDREFRLLHHLVLTKAR